MAKRSGRTGGFGKKDHDSQEANNSHTSRGHAREGVYLKTGWVSSMK